MNIQKSFVENEAGYGSLYLVGTPIGNLQDMTYRAVATLKEVTWIAAEDTRQTRKLLSFYDIPARIISYHEHNKQASGAELLRLLLSGDSVALVSDAGLPAVSDPGYDLVKLAIENQIAVVPIPGANAALSALIISGMSTDHFLFYGFLPKGQKALKEALIYLQSIKETLILYEAPHRIVKTLQAMYQAWGDRRIALARELTKKFEEVGRGTLSEALSYLKEHPPLGEYCIVVEANDSGGENELGNRAWWEALSEEEHIEFYLRKGYGSKEAIKLTAQDRQIPKREIYNRRVRNKKYPLNVNDAVHQYQHSRDEENIKKGSNKQM